MSSPFAFSHALNTISVASTRVLPMLLAAPRKLSIYDILVAMHPLVTSFYVMILAIVLQLVLSLLTRSITWNDRAWSLVPPLSVLLFTLHPVLSRHPEDGVVIDTRLCIMTVLVLLWSVRLTTHAYFRNVYASGSVDYRYHFIRTNLLVNRLHFCIFYIFVVCMSLTALLTVITAPVYFAWVSRNKIPLSYLDYLATGLTLVSIIIQTLADIQQQTFQHVKYANWSSSSAGDMKHNLSQDVRDGFLQSGLFAWCRHPNFCAELCIWFSFHLFSIAAGGSFGNWTIAGPLLYVLLFQVSTTLTERISVSKYPRYADYQKRVPRLYPSPFAKPKPPSLQKDHKAD